MPTYSFRNESGGLVELTMSYSALIESGYDADSGVLEWEGERLTRDIAADHIGFKKADTGWPQHSIAAAVLPSQVGEAASLDRKLGVPTNYDRNGSPIFENKAHRAKWMKAHKWVDRNSYTGY